MKKRIIYNLVFAFVLIPIAISIRDYVQIDILKDPAKFAGTFSSYFLLSLPFVFGAIPLVFFLFVLLPYSVMISKLDGLAQRPFLVKAAVLMGIITIVFSLFGTFSNVWRYPYIQNLWYLVSFALISLVFSYLNHAVPALRTSSK